MQLFPSQWKQVKMFSLVSIHVTYRKMIICSVFLQNSMNLSAPQLQDTSPPNHLPLLPSMQGIQGLFLCSSLLCSWNYTGWLQVDSQASGIYSLRSFLTVLIMLLLSLVFYRLQIWLNEAMGSLGGGAKNNITYCLNIFLMPIDLWWLKECTQRSAWNIISTL